MVGHIILPNTASCSNIYRFTSGHIYIQAKLHMVSKLIKQCYI